MMPLQNFDYFVWTPWVVELTIFNIYKFLPSSSLEDVFSLILFPLFATGFVDTDGNFATGINNTNRTGSKICRQCR
jgi:hypothetical protein